MQEALNLGLIIVNCVDGDVPIPDIDACTWSKLNIDGYFLKF